MYDTALALERLAWAWFLLAVSLAIYRTINRVIHLVRGQKPGELKENQGEKVELAGEALGMYPLWSGIMCHLLSWRLATSPPAGVPNSWKWPWDVVTIVGLAGGGMSSWAEVMRLIRLLRPTPGM